MIGPESERLATIVSWIPPTLVVAIVGSSLFAMALLLRVVLLRPRYPERERRAAFEIAAWTAPGATIVALAAFYVSAIDPASDPATDLDDGPWLVVLLALGLAWFLAVACWWLTRSPRSRPRAKR